jgi:hypothetical protein
MKRVLDIVVSADFTLHSVHGQLPFGEGGIGEVCCLAAVVHSAVRNNNGCTPRWPMSQYRNSGNTGDRRYS